MDYLPICINIKNEKILVVGGSNVALHKLTTLIKFCDKTNIFVLAKDIKDEIRALGVNCIQKEFEPADAKGYKLIYACTNLRSINSEVFNVGTSLGSLVNCADDPMLSNFVSPAVEIVENDLIVAVSSDAKNVKKAIYYKKAIIQFIKELIEKKLRP